MIIIGYPGVGKSTLAEKYRYNYEDSTKPKSIIDLESSIFNVNNSWATVYCAVARKLSEQGHLVFISSHEEVQLRLREYDGPVAVVYPSLELKQEWIQKLRYRYENCCDDEKRKNFHAYDHACDSYEEDIEALKNNGFQLIEITDMKYSLEELIFGEEV